MAQMLSVQKNVARHSNLISKSLRGSIRRASVDIGACSVLRSNCETRATQLIIDSIPQSCGRHRTPFRAGGLTVRTCRSRRWFVPQIIVLLLVNNQSKDNQVMDFQTISAFIRSFSKEFSDGRAVDILDRQILSKFRPNRGMD
jgi:hypothetical protein